MPFIVQVLETKPISKQCDVYSYGIVVWELLTHKIPFEDVTTIYEICKRVVEDKEVGGFSGISVFPGLFLPLLSGIRVGLCKED